MKEITLTVVVVCISFSFAVGQKLELSSPKIRFCANNLSYQAGDLNSSNMFKDPRKAFLLSLGHFAVPTLVGSIILSNSSGSTDIVGGIILSYGILVGPSMGNFYARDESRSVGGLAVRVIGGGLMLAGVLSWANDFSNSVGNAFSTGRHTDSGESGVLLFLAGASITAGGIIFNLATAGQSARDYNRMHKLGNVSVTPVYFSQQKAPGLAFNIRF